MLKKYTDYYRENKSVLVHRGTVLENLFTTELQTAEIIEREESFEVSAFALLVTTNILDSRSYPTVESVLKVYADVCKAQFFGDCNKRTSYLFVNYLLAKNDMGYFS